MSGLVWVVGQFIKSNPALVIGVSLAIAFAVVALTARMRQSEKEELGQFAVGAAVLIAILLAAIFGLVKFVQWAWNS